MARFFIWCLLLLPLAAEGVIFTMSIADMVAPEFSARGIRLLLPADGSAELQIAELRLQQRNLRKVRIRCADFELSVAGMKCHSGSLAQLPGMIVEFDYLFGIGKWNMSMRLQDVQCRQLAEFIPANMLRPNRHGASVTPDHKSAYASRFPLSIPPPQAGEGEYEALRDFHGNGYRVNQGSLNGTLHISGKASGLTSVTADIRMADAGFSDASSMHAAERLSGSIKFSATRNREIWDWQGNVTWQSGELFWQPLYLGGGYRLSASGSIFGDTLRVEQAVADSPDVGQVRLALLWDMKQGALLEGKAQGSNLSLEKLFADYARPFLDKGALSGSSLYGHADVDWHYRDGATQSLRLKLRDAGIADSERRFALLGVNSEIDWRTDEPETANIAFAGGALLGVPLGSGQWTVQMHGMEFGMVQGMLPVLDGRLDLRDFRLKRVGDDWNWQFSAALSQVSMEQFSQAAGWPRMLGTLAGSIPRVSYDGDEINVDGALLFNLFDGTAAVTRLKLIDPFGRAPRLSGNLNMRNLDLDLLTRTFSFGNMQGRIDLEVNNLELQNWLPARFDARLFSSAGNYRKKISQKAVQNISALGGAGAASAIQRSYLRFFENFGYDRIDWRCIMQNGICTMGGMDQGDAYVIVKGGGIPAITVMGYNRRVSWGELITRLKRVTQGNLQAVVK